MDKITEALAGLLPEDKIKEVSAAIEASLAEAKAELEKEFNTNLEEAYAALAEERATEKANDEKIAIEGYQQAWDIISDLRNRNEMIKAEYDAALEEGYEEAYQVIEQERGKNRNIEEELSESYEKKFQEGKSFIVDKLDLFLRSKGKELYENARRDVANDPSMVEHKVVLENIVETVSDYITDEDRIHATSSKLSRLQKDLDDTKALVRRLESNNIKLKSENTKLTEAVKEAAELISESTEVAAKEEKKARVESVKNATGRGEIETDKNNIKVIAEYANNDKSVKAGQETEVVVEGFDAEQLRQMQVLAGTKKN